MSGATPICIRPTGLKYHLRTTPACLHGLRVQVGEVYSYGTGTKRSGQRRHVGMPAVRLPGPLNATPAQRAAALEGRVCTDAELADELRRATGASRVDEWSNDVHVTDPHILQAPAVTPVESFSALFPLTQTEPQPRYFHVIPASQADNADSAGVSCVSPFWPGLIRAHGIWKLPRAWHQYWPLWRALEAGAAWDLQHRRAFSILRKALPSSPRPDGPSSDLIDLVSATVTFRRICECVSQGGAFWIQGRPSAAGQQLFREVLPDAKLYSEHTPSGTISFVTHPDLEQSPCINSVSSFCDVEARADVPSVLPLRASLVYRTKSSARG